MVCTCCTMVRVPRSRISASRSFMPLSRRRRRRSADSWMGVRGFLISCARRRATSPQAASRCACRSVVMSSNTITKPVSVSSPGSGVQAHISVRRPAAPSRSSCSRHSSRPPAKRTASAATNCPRRSLPAASSGSERPLAADRSVPRIAPAASFAVRTVRLRSMASTPVERRARMMARRWRSRSTACWLWVASACARRSRLVMSLKECTRKPISSREGSGRRVPKSPLPTARVPSMRSCTGRTRRCAE